MTREEAYDYLREEASDTQFGLMVHITRVEKAIKAVGEDDELIDKALEYAADYESDNSIDWVDIDNAKYFIDVALGMEDEEDPWI